MAKLPNETRLKPIEIILGLTDEFALERDLHAFTATLLRGSEALVILGKNYLTKVMTLVGVSSRTNRDAELRKIDHLAGLPWGPDAIMDLSIVGPGLSEHAARKFPGPVGTLPHYLVYKPKSGIDPTALLERIHALAEAGIAFLTIHPTPTTALYGQAQRTRRLPSTARGGGMVIRDMALNNRSESVFAQNFGEILKICSEYRVALSIGAAFRPSSIFEALDIAHVEETKAQSMFIRIAKDAGVHVIQEGLGHIRLSEIPRYAEMIAQNGVPFMPLGPIVTDAAVGFDHVVAAIGATQLGLLGFAQMINSVTREEHTGRVPSHQSVLEGLMSARTAAHAINISKFPNIDVLDRSIAESRQWARSCVVAGGLFDHGEIEPTRHGCNRCSFTCPLHLA